MTRSAATRWPGPSSDALVRDHLDGETGLERVFSPPAARTWTLDGWASAAPDAKDSELDALVGVRGALESSGALRGPPGLPRLERVRRHAAAVDRLVAGRPHGVALLDHAAPDDGEHAHARAGRRCPPPDRRCGSTTRRRSTSGPAARSGCRRRSARARSGSRSCAPPLARTPPIVSAARSGSPRSAAVGPPVERPAHRRAEDACVLDGTVGGRAASPADDRHGRGLRRRPPAARQRLRAGRPPGRRDPARTARGGRWRRTCCACAPPEPRPVAPSPAACSAPGKRTAAAAAPASACNSTRPPG